MLADLGASVLPAAPQLQLDSVDVGATAITLGVSSIQVSPTCPACGHSAHRVHSRYERTLADLPWPNLAARIQLHVRRFFCEQPACPRTTFAEGVPALTRPYGRRTHRLKVAQQGIALALGGAPGARLSDKLRMPTSRNTLLRLLRQLPVPAADVPRVVGLDDWAKRKGHTYGTIVVDLETHAPIDLLDDRSADTVETWLKACPSVEVVSRDRSEAYASATTSGAPNAIQVADRWHILKNLREAIEQELAQRKTQIARTTPPDASANQVASAATRATTGSSGIPDAPAGPARSGDPRAAHPQSAIPAPRQPERPMIYRGTPAGRRAEAARQARRAARLARYKQIVALRKQGWDKALIARTIGVSARSVTRWLAAGGFPERKPRSGHTSSLDPYKATLLERWKEGCHNATHLWRMIQAQGFAGCYELVANYLAPLRRGEAVAERPANLPPAAPTTSSYTAREAAFLFLRRSAELTDSEQQELARMREQDGAPAAIYQLTQELASMVRERHAENLDRWLMRAATSGYPELQRFADGIRRDYAAVRAALRLPWSQGPVEGQITKLKLVKRQMYGRGKLDLLRVRLHAA